MFSQELEKLIDAAIADGEITSKEREALTKRALAEGVNLEELDMIVDSRLQKVKEKTRQNIGLDNSKRNPEDSPAKQLQNKIATIAKNSKNEIKNLNNQEIPYYKAKNYHEYYLMEDTHSRNINEAENRRNKNIISAIETHYVPPIEEDVYDMLEYLHPMTTDDYMSPYDSSYDNKVKKAIIAKYKQCLQIAKKNFSEHPEFKKFFDEESKKREMEKKKKEEAKILKEKESRQTLSRLQKEVKEAKDARYKGNYEEEKKRKSKAVAVVIESFILPTEREELLELMKYLRPFYNKKVWKDREDDYVREAKAYRNKYIESCELAKTLFYGDSEFEKEIIVKEKKEGFLGFLQSLGIDI